MLQINSSFRLRDPKEMRKVASRSELSREKLRALR